MFKFLGRDNSRLTIAFLFWALGEGLWYNLHPIYLEQLGASPEQIGTVLGIERAAAALLMIPAGLLSDRLGARRVMIAGSVLGVAGAIAMTLATTWQALAPGLAAYHMSAFFIPALNAYILLAMPNRDEDGAGQRALSLVYASYPAGMVISPTLGGLIAEAYGIRMCIRIAIILCSLSLLVTMSTRHHETAPRHVVIRSESLTRNRAFQRLLVYYVATMLSVGVGFFLVQNFLHEARGFSLGRIGLLYSILSIGTVVANLILGRINPRRSFALLLVAIWLAMVGAWQVHTLAVAGAAFFLMGAIYTMRTLAAAGIALIVPRQDHGLSFGVLETGMALAAALAGKLAGEFFAWDAELPLLFSMAAIPLALAAWFVVRGNLAGSHEVGVPVPGD
jgi:MFS family permease